VADNILNSLEKSLEHPEFSGHYFCLENYDMKLLSNLYQNRVVLVGDAAHPMGSIMGLNANLALEDARSLSLHLHNEKNTGLALTKYSLEQIQKIIPIIDLEIIFRWIMHFLP
jgi:2-polyprenyl-6-methoxyphenol hydroxylase-like FAD-dependent oxidoreductase